MSTRNQIGLHQGQPRLVSGVPLGIASRAMILVHGRGASAENIMELTRFFKEADFAFVAPQAKGNSWYPHSFLSPLEMNEPGLSSSMAVLTQVLEDLESAGIPPNRIFLLGFSQGACLSLEYVARHARRYGGVAGLSGGLIGPDNTSRNYGGSLQETPIFLGCSDTDFHIPKDRVHHTTAILRGMGGRVTERLYQNSGHTINEDEIEAVRHMLKTMDD